jgi:4-amino-4-deoxy-L-arabinose transferase-like glycosyltransferase
VKLNRASLAVGVFAALAVAAAAISYVFYLGYIEHGEATIVAAAFRLLSGHPAYHPFGAPERTSNVYGPWTYLWTAWPMALFGAKVWTSKLATSLAPILVLAVAWAVGRRFGTMGLGLALAWTAGGIITHLPFTTTVRPDSLLTLMVAVAVWAAARADSKPGMAWTETILIAVASGIAVNIKIHAGLYLAPVVLFHLWPHWWRLVPMAAAGLAALALPFASPLFPLGDYLSWFGPMSAKENAWNAFRILWMRFALYLVIPAVLWGMAGWRGIPGRMRAVLALYALCILVALFPATKVGASHHYYMPFVPTMVLVSLIALERADWRLNARRWALGLAVLLLAMGAQTERRFFKVMEWQEARDVVAEIQAIQASHAGQAIQMGVGGPRTEEKFFLYSWRHLLVFGGGPFTLDTGIVMEMTKLGVPLPDETYRRLAGCETQIWLTPKGEAPFSLIGYYDQTVYDQRFRDTFAAHMSREGSGRFFDIWRCR